MKKTKQNKKCEIYFGKANLILLAVLMIVPGVSKLFMSGPAATAGFLDSLGFPIAIFFAWLLIALEIGSGVAILAKWKLNVVKYVPVVILLVAILTVHINDLMEILIRLVLVSNYLLLKQK